MRPRVYCRVGGHVFDAEEAPERLYEAVACPVSKYALVERPAERIPVEILANSLDGDWVAGPGGFIELRKFQLPYRISPAYGYTDGGMMMTLQGANVDPEISLTAIFEFDVAVEVH